MKKQILCAMLTLVSPTLAGAQDAKPPAAVPAPTDAAALRKLVRQLGDPDYPTREEASRLLKSAGKAALPFLKEAMAGEDLEVVSRAQALVRRIESKTLPGGPFDPNAELRPTRIRMSANAGARVLEVSDLQRDVRIEQRAERITLTITGDVDGQRVTEEFSAASADELKKDNPEVYAIYDRWTGPGNGPGFILRGPMQIGGGGGIAGNVQIVGPGMVVGPAGAPDELDLLRLRLEKQFREKGIKADARDQITAGLEKLADSRAAGDMEAYTTRADDLRKVLDAEKLDAGDLLPPPAKLRLGVSIQSNPAADGLTVQRITEKSRGERLGLQVGDVIQKVEGKEVKSVADLRRAVGAKEAGLTMDIFREGKEVKLEEKAGEKKKE